MMIGEWVRVWKLLTVNTPDLLSHSNEERGSELNRMGGRAGDRSSIGTDSSSHQSFFLTPIVLFPVNMATDNPLILSAMLGSKNTGVIITLFSTDHYVPRY